MRALITGGSGFIGSHLAERLIHEGHSVIVMDDLSTGSMENILSVKNHPNFEYHIESILNRRLLAELTDLSDVVFHLAAAVGVRRIIDSPVDTIETNVKGCEVVLEMASKKKKKVVLTSTSEVYGKSQKIPFAESDDLVLGCTYNSRWSYAASKAIDEFLALAYYRERRVPVVIVRLFNTTGPRQTGHYGMVLPTFVTQALAGESLTVFGTGEQQRCFSHVNDIVTGLIAASQCPAAVGEIFNLGTTEEITIRALAERVIQLSESPSGITLVPYEEAYSPGFEDMHRRVPCIEKAHAYFGYRPTTGLNEIIHSVIAHMQAKNSEPAVAARA